MSFEMSAGDFFAIIDTSSALRSSISGSENFLVASGDS